MRITVSILILLFLSSCYKKQKLVETNISNLNSIIESDKYKINIKVGSGNVGGYFVYNNEIIINNRKISFNLGHDKHTKLLTKLELDSLNNVFRKMINSHDNKKIFQKIGGCGSFDANYILQNDSIKIIIKPNNFLNKREYYERIANFPNIDFMTVEESIEELIEESKKNAN